VYISSIEDYYRLGLQGETVGVRPMKQLADACISSLLERRYD